VVKGGRGGGGDRERRKFQKERKEFEDSYWGEKLAKERGGFRTVMEGAKDTRSVI